MREILISQFQSIGGPILAVLILVSVIATATVIVKLLTLSRLGVGRRKVADEALKRWAAGDLDGAQRLVGGDRGALSRVIAIAMEALWRWPEDKGRAREIATANALTSLDMMNRHMRVLETSVQAAPMLGLLGTVLGMIAAFNEMARGGGAVDPTQLAGGIWVALSTTALGLIIAVPLYFVLSWFEGRIEREGAAMETAILSVVYGPGAEFARDARTTAAGHGYDAEGLEPAHLLG